MVCTSIDGGVFCLERTVYCVEDAYKEIPNIIFEWFLDCYLDQ